MDTHHGLCFVMDITVEVFVGDVLVTMSKLDFIIMKLHAVRMRSMVFLFTIHCNLFCL